jgi:hypothetical protein
MPPVIFEPKIVAGERPQTYVLDRAATGTDTRRTYLKKIKRGFANNQQMECRITWKQGKCKNGFPTSR